MTLEAMLSLFYGHNSADKKFTDFLHTLPFDELFEIDTEKDTIHNLYHTPNKYALPVMEGKLSTIYRFTADHFVHPEHRSRHTKFMDPFSLAERAAASPCPGILTDTFRILLPGGNYQWVRYMFVTGEDLGVPAGKWNLYVIDIQSQKDRESQASNNTTELDPLTGLPHSEDFFRLAAQLPCQGREMCCLALDIHHFTLFNAVYSHEKGDRLLTAFSAALRRSIQGRVALAGYLGLDDFVLVTEYDAAWISNLYKLLRSTIVTYGNTVGFSPVIGIYRLPQGAAMDLEMYDKALSAMMEAKLKPTERIAEYSAASRQTELEEFQVLIDLQKAIADQRLEIFLQPQCRMSNGKIVGAEALVRMRDTDGSLIPPGKFIPILEKNGCIADVDKIVWRMVCAWLRSLLDQGIQPVPISVNVSQMDILSMDVANYLYSLTEEFNIPTELLKVEITESFYAENAETVQRIVHALSARGFTTLMDDFGSGYSSLNLLETLPVEVLKLDMAFMRKSSFQTRRGVTIIESIINMAKMIGMPIIIEGVENEQQVQFLQSMGCRYAQGYYYHRPIPCSDFEKLISDNNMIDQRGIIGKANEQYHVREFLDDNTFTDAMLNNILGPVAFYSFDGKDLTITRFNQQFYRAIGDVRMESRQQGIQQYVVEEDRPALFHALEEALRNPTNGGSCEVRFYKSNGGTFWFRMHLFHLKTEEQKDLFYGQIQDVTELREQSLQFFEVLRQQSLVCMRINLVQETIQYVNSGSTLMQPGLLGVSLSESMTQTAICRIPAKKDKDTFMEFFNADRLRSMHRQGIYHETMIIPFLMEMDESPRPIEFSTYYIRYSTEQDLNVYVFVKNPG